MILPGVNTWNSAMPGRKRWLPCPVRESGRRGSGSVNKHRTLFASAGGQAREHEIARPAAHTPRGDREVQQGGLPDVTQQRPGRFDRHGRLRPANSPARLEVDGSEIGDVNFTQAARVTVMDL